ncbi:uncharacterized protein [Amphiura filiformis]|uniref:uncharacterized protein n=1 Tax=Amphiura filiformis TaxID=82378 RepID=UPI003B21617E
MHPIMSSSSSYKSFHRLLHLISFIIVFPSIHSQSSQSTSALPTGHLKPLGSHRPPDVEIDELNEVPSPREFYEKYVKHGRAVIFRGAAKESPGFKLWTDEYLREKYGDLEVRLEGKREKGSHLIPMGDKYIGRSSIGHFIDHYHTTNRYMVSELPTAMYPEFFVPPCLSCGLFRDRLVEIDIWMSGGDSHSILHKDAFNAINCLVNGTKYWKLIERKYEKWIYEAWEPDYEVGGYSEINVEEVDMIKHPDIAKVPWSKFTIHAGDCLFLPSTYYHQVSSAGETNLAIAVLFAFQYREYDDRGCNETEPAFIPLSEFDVVWEWPGHGYMTMGHHDIWEIKDEMLEAARENGPIRFDKELFRGADTDKLQEVQEILDPEGKGYLTVEDISKLDGDTLRKYTFAIEAREPSNTEEYEYTYVDYSELKDVIQILMDRDGALTKKKFILMYQEVLGGTKQYAIGLFDKLTRDTKRDKVLPVDIEQNLEYALEKYRLLQKIYPVPPGEEDLVKDEL